MARFLFQSSMLIALFFSQFCYSDEPFKSTYSDWKNTSNTFINYVDKYDQARVVFCGSAAFSKDNDGQVPTVSEGMGYGLLLSCANNDQELFDKFLRYVLATAENYGCSNYDPSKKICYAKSPLLMPWIVNDQGKPFNFLPSQGATTAYYSNGSATDADIQIAWAIYLASENVKGKKWKETIFKTSSGNLNYHEILALMVRSIRLCDIDIVNLRYIPGSQWGEKGDQVLYPGYFTPQAFDALDTIPAPTISTTPPSTPPKPPFPITQAADLQLVYVSNVLKSVSIDYLGGAGTLHCDSDFQPKSGMKNGYTVDPITTAIAVMSTKNQYYNNASIEAALYDASGQKTIYCNYYFEYNNGGWTFKNKGSSQEAVCIMKENVAYVYLTSSDAKKIGFSFSDVQKNSLQAIEAFQNWKTTGLFPNVLHYNKEYNQGSWENAYGYDATRFSLWVSSYIKQSPSAGNTSQMKRILAHLLTTLQNHIQKRSEGYTLPSGGVNALTGENEGDFSKASPPLDAPAFLAYTFMGESKIADELSGTVLSYNITKLQPTSNDAEGDSTPYFNAVMVLLTEALCNGKL